MTTTAKRSVGRPEILIDMKVVDDLLVSGCNGAEVAAYIGVHPETLYSKIERDFKVNFSNYSAQKRQKGDGILHAAQFKKAVNGDNTMLVWLGKNRLKQKDTISEVDVGEKTIAQFESIVSMLESRQAKSDLNISDKSKSAETRS